MVLSLDAPSKMNQLDAINTMLRAIGERPVLNIGPNTKPSAAEAQGVLAEALIAALSARPTFSTRTGLTLSPDVDGKIALPYNTLAVRPSDPSSDVEFLILGNSLVNKETNSSVFTGDIEVDLSLGEGFDTLGLPAQWYITMEATLQFLGNKLPQSPNINNVGRTLRQAKINFERHEVSLRPGGMSRRNPHFNRMRGR